MKINEVEQIVGITKKNIRFYEQEGLIAPARNSSNGYRDYCLEDVDILRKIKLLRKLGIPIEDIRNLQSRYLTLNDCLERQLIFLKREQENIASVEAFCRRMLVENLSLDSMNADELLFEMEHLEEGGTRFMNLHKKDKKQQKRNALAGAAIAVFLMCIPIFTIFFVALSGGFEEKGMPLFLVLPFTAIPLAGIAAAVRCLRERFKEIEGGELDEASKY